MEEGTYWFKRFVKECHELSKNIQFRRIKDGYYRIYWVGSGPAAYIGECYKEMPEVGYDIEEKDIYLTSQKYYEEYEDRAELTRKIKNFVEGYRELIDQFKTKIYMMKNNTEYRNMAIQRYSTLVVK